MIGARWLVVVGVTLAVLVGVGAWYGLHRHGVNHAPTPPPAMQQPLAFVGSDRCKSCHTQVYQAWSTSDHAAAMAQASAQTVRGDFAGSGLEFDGHAAAFMRRRGGFWARLTDREGQRKKYKVAYTFGRYPLQQYLVPFADGRLQALPYAWDARPADDGGQHWFVLNKQELKPDDPLHWTGPALNWDRSCASCHSTGLKQTYDPKNRHYSAHWSDIDVACEACHGPGSRHLAWAKRPKPDPNKGLVFDLTGASSAHWVFKKNDPIAHRVPAGADRTEVETCARCHARRAKIAAGYRFGRSLADSFSVALLDPGLYFVDGQQKGEVYEYGSFLQSRMYAHGVTCSNCHDPHTGQLRAQGNAVCAQCHKPKVFDTREHTHHRAGSPGAQCANCHMPARTYMQVDSRRDHSIRIPRPDLHAQLGTPDACTGCHTKHKPAWAARKIKQWHPDYRPRPHYGAALWAGRHWRSAAPVKLQTLADNDAQPAIVRASALKLLARFPGRRLARAAQRAGASKQALLRRAAAQALPVLPGRVAVALADRLLGDDVLTVRVAAAQQLLSMPERLTQRVDSQAWRAALGELRAGLKARRGRVESLLGLAALAQHDRNVAKASRILHEAVARRPDYPPAWLNLADFQRSQNRQNAAVNTLQRGLRQADTSAALHYALGLARVRTGQRQQGVRELARARRLAPDNPRYAYVYVIALHDTGRLDRARQVLARAEARFPAHPGISALARQYAAQSR